MSDDAEPARPGPELPEADAVRERLGAVLRELGARAVRFGGLVVVDHKAGRRAVIRADLAEPLDLPGLSPVPLSALFLKWSADPVRAARDHATLVALHRALAGAAAAPELPAPVATLPDLSLRVLGEVAGPTLAAVGLALDDAAATRLGRALARFHHCGAVLPARYVLGDELRTLRGWTDELDAAGCPAPLLERYRSTVEAVAEATASVPTASGGVLHRDLHEEHCIVGARVASGVGIIDLDEARSGDPVVDLGHLAVHLHLRAGTVGAELTAGPAAAVLAAWDRFAPSPASPAALRAFGAMACVKIARQRATGFGTAPRPAGTGRWPAVGAALGLAAALLDAG